MKYYKTTVTLVIKCSNDKLDALDIGSHMAQNVIPFMVNNTNFQMHEAGQNLFRLQTYGSADTEELKRPPKVEFPPFREEVKP